MQHILYSHHPTLGLVDYTSDPESRGLFRQRLPETSFPLPQGQPAWNPPSPAPVLTLVSPALLAHQTPADFARHVTAYTNQTPTSIHPNGGIPLPATNP